METEDELMEHKLSIRLEAGTRIREAREQRRWTQQHLAELARLSRSTIVNLEAGERAGASIDSYSACAAALEMNVSALFADAAVPMPDILPLLETALIGLKARLRSETVTSLEECIRLCRQLRTVPPAAS